MITHPQSRQLCAVLPVRGVSYEHPQHPEQQSAEIDPHPAHPMESPICAVRCNARATARLCITTSMLQAHAKAVAVWEAGVA